MERGGLALNDTLEGVKQALNDKADRGKRRQKRVNTGGEERKIPLVLPRFGAWVHRERDKFCQNDSGRKITFTYSRPWRAGSKPCIKYGAGPPLRNWDGLVITAVTEPLASGA